MLRHSARILFSAALMSACLWAAPVTYNQQWNPADYGHWDQNDPDFASVCGASACGPMATLNSLYFLMNKYPDLYKDADEPAANLVPDIATNTAKQDAIAAAQELACEMGCTPE